jgi:hypothetical protein
VGLAGDEGEHAQLEHTTPGLSEPVSAIDVHLRLRPTTVYHKVPCVAQ